MLIINEIHEDKNVGNYLIPTSGDFKDFLSKHTFIFGVSEQPTKFQVVRKPISTLLTSSTQ